MSFRDFIPTLVEAPSHEAVSAPIVLPPVEAPRLVAVTTEVEHITAEPTFRDHVVAKEQQEKHQLEQDAGIEFFDAA